MPARAYWSGQLRLALVSIPVEIFSAAKSGASISFRQIHEPTGKPIKYEKVVPGVGPVDTDEIMRGFEYEKGNYVLLTDEEVDEVKLESRKTLELTQFVEAHEIDAIYYDKPYYVVPSDELAEEAYRVIRDALRQTRKVGLGQLALRGRETICALKPCGRGMLLETLRYADEVNKAQSYFRSISDAESPPELLDLAKTLIEKRTTTFDPEAFHDRYQGALRDLIDCKLAERTGKPVPKREEAAPPKPSNVVDLMAALKQSLERTPAAATGNAKSSGSRSRSKAAALEAEEAPTKEAAAAEPDAKVAKIGSVRSSKPKASDKAPANDEAPKSGKRRTAAKAEPQRKTA